MTWFTSVITWFKNRTSWFCQSCQWRTCLKSPPTTGSSWSYLSSHSSPSALKILPRHKHRCFFICSFRERFSLSFFQPTVDRRVMYTWECLSGSCSMWKAFWLMDDFWWQHFSEPFSHSPVMLLMLLLLLMLMLLGDLNMYQPSFSSSCLAAHMCFQSHRLLQFLFTQQINCLRAHKHAALIFRGWCHAALGSGRRSAAVSLDRLHCIQKYIHYRESWRLRLEENLCLSFQFCRLSQVETDFSHFPPKNLSF